MATKSKADKTNPLDLLTEDLIEINQIPRELPRPEGAKPMSYQSAWRWVTRGMPSKNGRIVLESVKIGQQRYTSRQALHRFLQAQQG